MAKLKRREGVGWKREIKTHYKLITIVFMAGSVWNIVFPDLLADKYVHFVFKTVNDDSRCYVNEK